MMLVLACAACSDSPAEPADPAASGPPPAAAFTATVTPEKGSVAISYRFTNQTSADLVALNRIRYQNGYPRDSVYVTGRDDGRVEISKRAFAMPDTDKMEWVAFATVGGVIVPPGQSVAEDISVPLPLTRMFPYGNDLGDGEIKLPDPIREAVFCLGVIPLSALPTPAPSPSTGAPSPSTGAPSPSTGAPSLSGPAAGDGKIETTHSSFITAAQHLFCSAPVKL
jgi:hypothetical protein